MNFDKSYINIVQWLRETSNPLEIIDLYKSNIDFMDKNIFLIQKQFKIKQEPIFKIEIGY